MEFYMSLFQQDNIEGNRPHFKILCRIDGVEHEAAFWPAKDGKKGYTGKMKEKFVSDNVGANLMQQTDAAYKKVEEALTGKANPFAASVEKDEIPF